MPLKLLVNLFRVEKDSKAIDCKTCLFNMSVNHEKLYIF